MTAVDIDTAGIRAAAADESIEIIAADLEQGAWPLAERVFDGVVVVNYLHRAHFPLLCAALADDGILLFDTFAAGNERYGRPQNPDFLLRPGELLREFGSVLDIVAYEHGELREPQPVLRQRLCAIRR